MSEASLSMPPLSHDQRVWRWRILISTYLAYVGYYLCRKVFSLCKVPLSEEFNVGVDDIAHIWTAYLVAYMLGQFVNSFFGRKWGPRVLLLGGLGASMAINIVFGFANSYWTFLGFMFFNGLMQATGWPACVGGVAEWLRREERGFIMGIWSTNYLLGSIIVKSLAGYILLQYSWRYAFFGCTLAAFVIWWVVYFWQRDRPEDVGLPPIIEDDPEANDIETENKVQISFAEYCQLLVHPVVLLMGVAYFSLKFLRYALDSWLPTFLDYQGLDTGRAAFYSQIFDIAGFAGVFISGWALDKVFKGRWAEICLIMGIGLIGGYYMVAYHAPDPWTVALYYGLVGFMLYGPDTILCGAAAVQVAGERNAIAIAGLINGIGSIGPIVQEEVIALLMKNGDTAKGIENTNLLGLAMSVTFAVSMVAVIIAVRITRRQADERRAVAGKGI